jgi:hypothetical protein
VISNGKKLELSLMVKYDKFIYQYSPENYEEWSRKGKTLTWFICNLVSFRNYANNELNELKEIKKDLDNNENLGADLSDIKKKIDGFIESLNICIGSTKQMEKMSAYGKKLPGSGYL